MKQRVRSFCSNGEIVRQRGRSSTNREIVEQRVRSFCSKWRNSEAES